MNLDKIKYKKEHVAFTYHICWVKQNLHYYGLRTAKGCNPTDIWTTYFTSSNPVKELKKTLGKPDVIETRKIFKNSDKAIVWEATVLRRLKVTKRDDWINECSWPSIDNRGRTLSQEHKDKISKSNIGKRSGKKHSKETKKKISKSNRGQVAWNKGKSQSKEIKEKISKSLIGNTPWNKGKIGVYSEESLKKMSEAQTGEKNPNFGKRGEGTPNFGKHPSKETRRKISEAMKGKKISEEHKKKISEAQKGEKHHMYRKKHSKETLKRMSESQKKRRYNEKVLKNKNI